LVFSAPSHHPLSLTCSAAYNVLVKDDSWPEANFTTAHGTPLASFDKVLPGTNVTHNYVIRASKPGKYPTEPAYIYYSLTPAGQQNQNAVSSHMGLIRVWRANEVERKSAPHFREWGVFTLIALLSVAFPLLAYLQITLNYEKGVPKALLAKSKRA
jgi:hypothetical protein